MYHDTMTDPAVPDRGDGQDTDLSPDSPARSDQSFHVFLLRALNDILCSDPHQRDSSMLCIPDISSDRKDDTIFPPRGTARILLFPSHRFLTPARPEAEPSDLRAESLSSE
ncbi:hypothetical protein M430DRAFT_242467 [Amorphotheca resinae ATCC 22711]|jgi:hypothetical protein|uniref:Uncharacterized protein n=1 Tax=Amorphotheca resinae ATCC 22711 TaxID=857342 RepID=A0A2T3B288_AMORE|nr:hypothetical protein M430DRAFT_242467 [Amorphotheca resinae ATCC 22711]PSS18667.1 hypothetical protein M430DRAFT_242467 [Amorphotheca resinae ATCC 22711]